MGFKLPAALAGSSNNVALNQSGAKRVIELIGGSAIATGILVAGAFVFKQAMKAAGSEQQKLGDWY